MGRIVELSEVETWPTARQAAYHRERMEAAIREAARKAEAAYRADHPQAGALRTKSDIHVYRRPPKGFYRQKVDIVETWLTSRLALQETNAAAVSRLNDKFTPYAVSANYLTRPLPKSTVTAIQKLLAENGMWLDLRKHNTLSKIKRALRAAVDAKSTARHYQVAIAFNEDALVVGDTRLPVYQHPAGYLRVRVGKQWLRCDVLEELAQRASA
jgi:hypothetical protein